VRRAVAEAPAVAAPAGRAADVVVARHLHAQAGREALFGYADTPEQYAEAVASWSATLSAAGVTPGTPSLASGMWVLPYTAPAGKVIRGFMADPRQFPPKDDAGLRANMALAQAALADAGLTVVSAKVLNLEFLLPTYSLLYMTDANATPAHETRLRLLVARDESDFDLFRDAGIRVVQVPKPWMMVYVGREAGVVHMGAKDAEAAAKKLAERRAFLTGQGKTIVAERVTPYDDADMPFVVSLYFLH
ncbi:MAG: hypothetical protein SF051_10105, partial [Elusimicrobiota bacterium]|nr:hypothetical protein [Elusimicrobiota bacterium]